MQSTIPGKTGITSTEHTKENLSKNLIWVSIASCFLSMQYGYNIWISYSPTVLMDDFYNVTTFEEMGSQEARMFFLAFIIALFPLGGIFGAIAAGILVDRIGRKKTFFVANFFSIASAVFMALSNLIYAFEYTMFARLFTGICTGIISSAVPIYLCEISPRNRRGGIVMMPHLFLSFGVLLAQILALHDVLGTQRGWPILMGLAGIMPLSQLALLPLFPESPRYLLIQKEMEEEAIEALKMLRERDDVNDEIEELRQEKIAEKAEKHMSVLKLLKNQAMRLHVLTIVVLVCGKQLAGSNAVYYYTERIYVTTNVGPSNVHYISIGSTIFVLCSTSFGIYLVESVGRRVPLLLGFLACAVILVLITMALEMQHVVPAMSNVSSVLVVSFLCGHSFGPGPVPPVIITELFLQSSRASAFIIAGTVEWATNFVIGITFLHIEKQLGIFSFLLFFPVCVAVFAYSFKVLPETKNRTFVDIRRIMAVQTARKIQAKA